MPGYARALAGGHLAPQVIVGRSLGSGTAITYQGPEGRDTALGFKRIAAYASEQWLRTIRDVGPRRARNDLALT